MLASYTQHGHTTRTFLTHSDHHIFPTRTSKSDSTIATSIHFGAKLLSSHTPLRTSALKLPQMTVSTSTRGQSIMLSVNDYLTSTVTMPTEAVTLTTIDHSDKPSDQTSRNPDVHHVLFTANSSDTTSIDQSSKAVIATSSHHTSTVISPTNMPTQPTTWSGLFLLEVLLPPVVGGSLLFLLCPILFCACRRCIRWHRSDRIRTRKYKGYKYLSL